jgi:hypothetical protein
MYLKLFATLATLAVPAAMFAQASPEVINPVGSNLEDVFQVNYASNLQLGDAAINITNAGTAGGDICANIYVFSPDEQEAWALSFGAGNLLNNPASVGTPYKNFFTSAVVKILATNPAGPAGCTNTRNNNHGIITANSSAGSITPADLVPGLTAWATHAHFTNTGTAAITETRFEPKGLSAFEFGFVVNTCHQNLVNLSGKGQCSCPTNVGGLVKPKL